MTNQNTSDIHSRIKQVQEELTAKRKELKDLRKQAPNEPVSGDIRFAGADGKTVTLEELFGDRNELIMIHNMGKSCRYCTLWADGFNGLLPHFCDRAAFVVVSPDPPDVQQAFANSRGWRFPMWSADTELLKQFEMADEKGAPWPGVSVFKKHDGEIVRTGYDYFVPGDDYCSIWHIMDLFPEGPGGWEPQYQYGR